MHRTLICSLIGAVAGFLVSAAVIAIAAGAEPKRDAVAIITIISIFLAGMGAIAGAIVGGVADLKEFFIKKDRASRELQERDKERFHGH